MNIKNNIRYLLNIINEFYKASNWYWKIVAYNAGVRHQHFHFNLSLIVLRWKQSDIYAYTYTYVYIYICTYI